MLERHGIQTSSSFVKILQVCIHESSATFLFFCVYNACFLSKKYWSQLYHDHGQHLRKKHISILAGNYNSGRSYLITAVPGSQSMNICPPSYLGYLSPSSFSKLYAITYCFYDIHYYYMLHYIRHKSMKNTKFSHESKIIFWINQISGDIIAYL